MFAALGCELTFPQGSALDGLLPGQQTDDDTPEGSADPSSPRIVWLSPSGSLDHGLVRFVGRIEGANAPPKSVVVGPQLEPAIVDNWSFEFIELYDPGRYTVYAAAELYDGSVVYGSVEFYVPQTDPLAVHVQTTDTVVGVGDLVGAWCVDDAGFPVPGATVSWSPSGAYRASSDPAVVQPTVGGTLMARCERGTNVVSRPVAVVGGTAERVRAVPEMTTAAAGVEFAVRCESVDAGGAIVDSDVPGADLSVRPDGAAVERLADNRLRIRRAGEYEIACVGTGIPRTDPAVVTVLPGPAHSARLRLHGAAGAIPTSAVVATDVHAVDEFGNRTDDVPLVRFERMVDDDVAVEVTPTTGYSGDGDVQSVGLVEAAALGLPSPGPYFRFRTPGIYHVVPFVPGAPTSGPAHTLVVFPDAPGTSTWCQEPANADSVVADYGADVPFRHVVFGEAAGFDSSSFAVAMNGVPLTRSFATTPPASGEFKVTYRSEWLSGSPTGYYEVSGLAPSALGANRVTIDYEHADSNGAMRESRLLCTYLAAPGFLPVSQPADAQASVRVNESFFHEPGGGRDLETVESLILRFTTNDGIREAIAEEVSGSSCKLSDVWIGSVPGLEITYGGPDTLRFDVAIGPMSLRVRTACDRAIYVVTEVAVDGAVGTVTVAVRSVGNAFEIDIEPMDVTLDEVRFPRGGLGHRVANAVATLFGVDGIASRLTEAQLGKSLQRTEQQTNLMLAQNRAWVLEPELRFPAISQLLDRAITGRDGPTVPTVEIDTAMAMQDVSISEGRLVGTFSSELEPRVVFGSVNDLTDGAADATPFVGAGVPPTTTGTLAVGVETSLLNQFLHAVWRAGMLAQLEMSGGDVLALLADRGLTVSEFALPDGDDPATPRVEPDLVFPGNKNLLVGLLAECLASDDGSGVSVMEPDPDPSAQISVLPIAVLAATLTNCTRVELDALLPPVIEEIGLDGAVVVSTPDVRLRLRLAAPLLPILGQLGVPETPVIEVRFGARASADLTLFDQCFAVDAITVDDIWVGASGHYETFQTLLSVMGFLLPGQVAGTDPGALTAVFEDLAADLVHTALAETGLQVLVPSFELPPEVAAAIGGGRQALVSSGLGFTALESSQRIGVEAGFTLFSGDLLPPICGE